MLAERMKVAVFKDQNVELRGIHFTKMDFFFHLAAALALVFSIYLWVGGRQEAGLFVGLWVPTIVSLNCFYKIAKARFNYE